ncbi:hypothetical protein AB0L40_25355 [Patulibacter sp. NPDC049589]|uniref:hypothetical protein n=1 Tax=Patulibacter sp. NPDC049589 TaxID=3154731 RepID=UPI0034471ED6
MPPTVQKNFLLPVEQAEWLREEAHRTRRGQVEIVREALADYRRRVEREASERAGAGEPRTSLVERFRTGAGIDLEILRDEDRAMWELTER